MIGREDPFLQSLCVDLEKGTLRLGNVEAASAKAKARSVVGVGCGCPETETSLAETERLEESGSVFS